MTNYHVYKDDTKPLECWLFFTVVESEQRRRVRLKSRSINRCLHRWTFWTNWVELEFGWKWRAKVGSLTGYENRVWEEWKQSWRSEKCHSGLSSNAGTAARSATLTNKNWAALQFFYKKIIPSRLFHNMASSSRRGGTSNWSTGWWNCETRRNTQDRPFRGGSSCLRWRSQWRTNGHRFQHKITCSQRQPQESQYEHFSPVWCFNTTIVTYANWPDPNQSWTDDL